MEKEQAISMDRNSWLMLVSEMIEQHPEWVADTIYIMQEAIIKKLEDEREKSAYIEIALMTSLNEKTDKELLLRGVKELRAYGGTKWQEQQIKKLTDDLTKTL